MGRKGKGTRRGGVRGKKKIEKRNEKGETK